METQNQFIGGIFILFVLTIIIGLFGIKRKLGFFGVFIIGLGIGILAANIVGSTLGIIVGVIASVIALVVSPMKIESATTSISTTSIAEELTKLNDLKEKGVISETEFALQKEKLLKK